MYNELVDVIYDTLYDIITAQEIAQLVPGYDPEWCLEEGYGPYVNEQDAAALAYAKATAEILLYYAPDNI